ncbi:MAG: cytochrome c [Yoonia sp.]|jgi:cytochrome c
MVKVIRLSLIAAGALYLASLGQVVASPGGDAERGAQLYKKCSACHQVGEGARNRVGPQLNGLFGRAAALDDSFRYSTGMERAAAGGLVWDYDTLDHFLENPRSLISNTRMSFRGFADQQDRDDVLAYLRIFSDNPSDIPESAPTAAALDHAVAPEILAIIGDPAYGEYLSGECTSCHRASVDASGIPSIIGWPAEDFVTALHAYKDGVRAHSAMQMMAGRLSNEEIAALAAYFKDVE